MKSMEMLTKKMLGDTDVAKAEEPKYDYSDENLTKLPPRALESYLAKKYGTDRYVRERSSVFEEASKNKISDRESILTGPELEALSLIFEKQIKQMKNKAKGGVAEQMELFADGGLKDEGNTVDPVSGNEVPPGATQEEVRDDIPAQLSEGEFVFPADVVRYIGLEKLMTMRQEAKAGLARMEAMGQMGNADEATLPDDIPFTLDDLDTREETEDDVIKANIGTFVPPRFNTGQPYNPNVNPYQPTGAVPTPYMPYKPATGTGLLGASAQGAPETENRRYVNKTTGQVRMIPFVKATGQSLYPIPEGFVFEPEAPKEEAKTTKVQTTKVQPVDTGDGGDSGGPTTSAVDPAGDPLSYGGGTGGRDNLDTTMKSLGTMQLGMLTKVTGVAPAISAVASGMQGKPSASDITVGAMVEAYKTAKAELGVVGQNIADLTGYERDALDSAMVGARVAANQLSRDSKGNKLDEDDITDKVNALAEKYGIKDRVSKRSNINRQVNIGKVIAQIEKAKDLARQREMEKIENVLERQKDEERSAGPTGKAADIAAQQSYEQELSDSGADYSDYGDGSVADAYDDPLMNTGGLAGKKKKKPKVKKMKRGGLASKK